jgi:hypothetical protein
MKVGEVIIYNRQDCCKDSLFPLEVTVGDSYNFIPGKKACSVPSGQPNPVNIYCKQNAGRYLMVRVSKETELSICEVKIHAYPAGKEYCLIQMFLFPISKWLILLIVNANNHHLMVQTDPRFFVAVVRKSLRGLGTN